METGMEAGNILSGAAEGLPEGISRAAREEFVRHGYEGANIDRIVRRARVSKSSLYAHVRDKEELFRHVVKEIVEARRMRPLPALDGPAEEVLWRIARWARDLLNDAENMALYRTNIATATHFPELIGETHRWRRRIESEVLHFFHRMEGEGLVEAADLELIYNRFVLMAVGGLRDLVQPPESEGEAGRRAAAAIRAFLHGHLRAEWQGRPLPPVVSFVPRGDPAGQAGRAALRHEKDLRLSDDRVAALMAAAAGRFLEEGYQKAGMDGIAARGGVAKTTLYRQFGGKEALYREAMLWAARDGERAPLPFGPEVVLSLERVAAVLYRRFADGRNLLLLRRLIAEVPRFPEVSRAAWRARFSPELAELRHYFRTLAAAGILTDADIDLAAQNFHGLAVRWNALLTGPETPLPEAGIAGHAEEAVRVFLYGYAPNGHAPVD